MAVRKVIWTLLVIGLAGEVMAAGTTGAEFLMTEVPARAAALSAGTAGYHGSEGLTWNPASLIGGIVPEIGFTHFTSFADTAYEQLEVYYPQFFSGNWGAKLFYASTYDFLEFDEFGSEKGQLNNSDLLFQVAYNYSLGSGLHLGAALKGFSSTLADYSSQGMAMDIGLHYQSDWKPLAFAVVLQHLGTMTAFEENADPLPLKVIGGASLIKSFLTNHEIGLLVDVHQPLIGDEILVVSMGLEYRMHKMFFIRGGYRFLDELGALTLGAGARFAGIGLDYAYQPFNGLGDAHRFTLTYRFINKNKAEVDNTPESKAMVFQTPY